MDYKMEIQERAEELAEELHGKDFYDLPADEQLKIYTKASEIWTARQYERAAMRRED